MISGVDMMRFAHEASRRARLERPTLLRILIHGLNFSPELTGVGKYTGEMASWMASRGHEVHVVTAPPYYPAWKIGAGYRSRYTTERPAPNLTVYRCPLYVPEQPGGLRRVLHLLSFAVASLPVMLRETAWEPEVVFTVEPTLFGGPVALFAAMLAGAPAWLHVQDFEVDAAFDLGLLPSHGPVHGFALAVERRLMRAFRRVSTISAKMLERGAAKGVAADRLVLFPNWVDVEAIRPEPPGWAENAFRRELGLGAKVVLLYSGNMGAKQGLEMLVGLAEDLRGEERVHLLLCGDGSFRTELERGMAGRSNVTMLPLQPLGRLSSLLNAADVHLLPQRAGAADLVMPSKLTGMLASGRPVVVTADAGTQVAEVIGGGEEALGLVVPTEDTGALAGAVRRLAGDAELRARMGAAARRYAEVWMGREEVLLRAERELERIVGNVLPQFGTSV